MSTEGLPADGAESFSAKSGADPRLLLARWANDGDEWSRNIVRLVLASGRRLTDSDIEHAHQLFLEEKQILLRTLPVEPVLSLEVGGSDSEEALTLTHLSDVIGVNAIVSGSTIDFHAGLTILFGENGTGKTGYARILKTLANSRTADEILPDINDPTASGGRSATVVYQLGDRFKSKQWQGETGVPPFNRMTIFDSPAVNFHVDEDLAYVYTPASLALFNHVTYGVQGVQRKIDQEITALKSFGPSLLGRFDRRSTVYPMIETLGAATDLAELERLADFGDDSAETLKNLRLAVAALEADTASQQIMVHQRRARVFEEADRCLTAIDGLVLDDYSTAANQLKELRADYVKFRETLFAAADLPAPPDENWETFVRAGQDYREHLEGQGAHDESRCIYCRQPLDAAATDLLQKYREYLEDRIASEIEAREAKIIKIRAPLIAAALTEAVTFVAEHDESNDPPEVALLRTLVSVYGDLREKLDSSSGVDRALLIPVCGMSESLRTTHATTEALLVELREQVANRVEALATKQAELLEFEARVELKTSWAEITRIVSDTKRADRLATLARRFSPLLRQITDLSKAASDLLINQNFEQLFAEECKALRAPALRLEFVGREGKAQRRKVLTGNHKPSKILSEGEQKVLALADFLAEARLAGITAPIVFDDPVSSLDHRRINEVSNRIALLADDNQVVVFTHDIFFVTNLLARFEKSKRCTYFQVTDEDGVGKVTRATGPRWDNLTSLKRKVNESIQAAKATQGEARAALVRTGYDWVRSWCEVFVESELFADVTQRYQPNVKMTSLARIKPLALPDAIATTTKVFDDACRYIDGHSQPLVSLGVSPTLSGLEADWLTLNECQRRYAQASA